MDKHLIRAVEQLHRHYQTLITGSVHPTSHPVAKGDAREHGWRKLLRRFLPDIYGVKSGFIVDSQGKISQQIDCIIYRKDMAIELYSVSHHTVLPVEAVFGAFEVKPKINAESLKYASEKAESVAQLKISNVFGPNQRVGWRNAPEGVVMGLLADAVGYKKKWKVKPFLDLISRDTCRLSLFFTIEDGCVDFLETGYPASRYRHYEGPQALFNQLSNLVKAIAKLESGRQKDFSYLSNYQEVLQKPKHAEWLK